MHITHEHHDGYEQVVKFQDDDFHCTVAIHSTKLGPAVGGCRLRNYPSETEARADVLRLSRSMTYKCSLAGLSFGGGKAVIMAEQPTRDTMLRFGDVVNYFKGDFITAEDVGTDTADLAITGEITKHLTRIDGSVMTARGVIAAMMAGAQYQGQWGDSLDGVPIWVQGLGKVGMPLANYLCYLDHPNVHVSDLRAEAVDQACAAGAHKLDQSGHKFMAIYAPCALGHVVHADNVESLTYSIICGAANNQLVDDQYAEVLHKNNVLYLPDFLVNAGGVINGACEIDQVYDQARAESMTDDIGICVVNVLTLAAEAKVSPLTAANWLAEARL
jgi:leucine dehydrogenase